MTGASSTWNIGPLPIAATLLATLLILWGLTKRRRGEHITLSLLVIAIFLSSAISFKMVGSRSIFAMLAVSQLVCFSATLVLFYGNSQLGKKYEGYRTRDKKHLTKAVGIASMFILLSNAVAAVFPPAGALRCGGSARCETVSELFGDVQTGFSITYLLSFLSCLFFWLLLFNAAEIIRRNQLK